jgi:hypothetical protein
MIFSGHALAAKGKRGAAPKGPVETMDANDPAAQEVSEKKAAAPKPETEEELAAKEARADAATVKKSRARDKMAVFGNVLIGFGKAPEPGAGAARVTGKTTSATFMVGGHYDLSPQFTVGLRLPWTVGSAIQKDGTSASSQALGAPELMGEYRVELSPFTRLPVFFGLGIPIAQGNQDGAPNSSKQAYLNDVADAASGYRDPELYGWRRLPLVVGVGLDYQRKAVNVHAATKFVAGVNAGGKSAQTDPAGIVKLKPVTFRNVTSGGIAYQFLPKPELFGAFDAWVVYNAVSAVEYTSNQGAVPPTRLQFVFEPRVGARFGKISPSLGYVFPIGGRLADAPVSGLELHCDVAF